MTTPRAVIERPAFSREAGDGHGEPSPPLVLLSLTDSFHDIWPTLAADCGCRLLRVASAASSAGQVDSVCVISAGGAEAEIEPLLNRCKSSVAAVGAISDHRLAITLLRAGASDYFALPHELDQLRAWLRDQADQVRRSQSRRGFTRREQSKYQFAGILGDSPALHAALECAARVIPHASVTVLLTGETGTGKELVARAIHYNGPRREAPFVEINCAAIPEQLLETELFGHERGAFTDAAHSKAGLFEVANGGTLFLDEIGHLSFALQAKLLRVLENRSIRRVGATTWTPIDVRVIAATHVDLLAAVRLGRFREDLYYRLNVVPVRLPPLRDRSVDVLPLARHYLRAFAEEYQCALPILSLAAEHSLLMRSWPGNVRELRNLMERAVLLAQSHELGPEDFPEGDDELPPSSNGMRFPATMIELEREAAAKMLRLCAGNKSDAARRLGVSRSRLHRLLRGSASAHNETGEQHT
jgi:DNA-binding NtrC family response regulator